MYHRWSAQWVRSVLVVVLRAINAYCYYISLTLLHYRSHNICRTVKIRSCIFIDHPFLFISFLWLLSFHITVSSCEALLKAPFGTVLVEDSRANKAVLSRWHLSKNFRRFCSASKHRNQYDSLYPSKKALGRSDISLLVALASLWTVEIDSCPAMISPQDQYCQAYSVCCQDL